VSVERSELANGLTVVSHAMPEVETVSLGLWIGAGSRSEASAEHGVAHFLEHMAFKGTARRSARDIAEEIEAVGGELNAATGVDSTAYYARVMRKDVALALDILSDIILAPRFDRSELSRERDVILQEIAASMDSPEDIAFDLVQEAAFPGQPVGRPILGTADSVRSFRRTHLGAYLSAHYHAPNMVLAAAGAIDYATLVIEAERRLGALDEATPPQPPGASYGGGVKRSGKPFEQTHLVLAFEAPAYRHPDYFAAQICAGALGGGMSSRLFQEIREQRGLCYAIYTFHTPYSDSGMFGLYAGTDAADVSELMRVVVAELHAAAENISEAEVRRAKAQMKAGLLMALESSGARAEQLARQILNWGRPIPLEELVAKIEAVSVESTRAAGRALIARGQPALAAVGRGRGIESAAAIAETLMPRAA
jgi:predicted Zn-dependent peptidase